MRAPLTTEELSSIPGGFYVVQLFACPEAVSEDLSGPDLHDDEERDKRELLWSTFYSLAR